MAANQQRGKELLKKFVIAVVVLGMAVLIVTVVAASREWWLVAGISGTILGIILAAFFFKGIGITPTQEAWLLEIQGLFIGEWESGFHLRLGIITRVIKVSLLERLEDIFQEETRGGVLTEPWIPVEDGRVRMNVVVTWVVTNAYKFNYTIRGGEEAIAKLIVSGVQDVIATLVRPMKVDDVLQLAGADIEAELVKLRSVVSSVDFRSFAQDLENMGVKITSVFLKVPEPSPAIRMAREDVAVATFEKQAQETRVDTEELKGRADAARKSAETWRIARELAGILPEKLDKNLVEEDKTRIIVKMPEAHEEYRERLRIEMIGKADTLILGESDAGKAASAEAARLAMSKSNQKS